jgi:F-type H+-transporting ATPase subunit b
MALTDMQRTGLYSKQNKRGKRRVLCVAVMMFFLLIAGIAYSSSDGEQAPKGWVKTDTYRVMNFFVLAAGLVLLLRKPVSEALSSRIKEIQSHLADLEAKRKNAEKEVVQYVKKLSDLDKESEKIIEQFVQQGNDAKAKILKEAKAAAEKLEVQANRSIENEFKRAKESIKSDLIEKSLVRAEELIKSRINEADQARLVDEYLEKVVA